MDPIEYNVGDIVSIREWDDMASEYAISGGDIIVGPRFTASMAKYCGKQYRISQRRPSIGYGYIYNLEGAEGWNFSVEMFESPFKAIEALPDIDIDIDLSELFD